MEPDERLAFEQQCAKYAMDGRYELYKTSKRFDGPPGREQHGFPGEEELSA
jgi:hypothetical protein